MAVDSSTTVPCCSRQQGPMDRKSEIWSILENPHLFQPGDAFEKSARLGSRLLTRALDKAMRKYIGCETNAIFIRRQEVQKIRTAILIETRMKVAAKSHLVKRTTTSVSLPAEKWSAIPGIRPQTRTSAISFAVGTILLMAHGIVSRKTANDSGRDGALPSTVASTTLKMPEREFGCDEGAQKRQR